MKEVKSDSEEFWSGIKNLKPQDTETMKQEDAQNLQTAVTEVAQLVRGIARVWGRSGGAVDGGGCWEPCVVEFCTVRDLMLCMSRSSSATGSRAETVDVQTPDI